MANILYVEDYIVPIISVPKTNNTKFRFLGTGFYLGNDGYLLTCSHVINDISDGENLLACQLGKRRELELKVIRSSKRYDIALCKSIPPEIEKPLAFIDETYLEMGMDIEVYGYADERLGKGKVPFRQRYLKGYITGIPREESRPHSFELNIPILFGMSGSPLVCHLPHNGDTAEKRYFAGITYGSSESKTVQHTIIEEDNYSERVCRIVELGLSYMPTAIFSLLREADLRLDLDILSRKVRKRQ